MSTWYQRQSNGCQQGTNDRHGCQLILTLDTVMRQSNVCQPDNNDNLMDVKKVSMTIKWMLAGY